MDKQAGKPFPWTADPILTQFRFCNVFRELDKVTIWVREHIREPYADHPLLWHMMLTARYINWPDTLGEVMRMGAWYRHDVFNWKEIAECMHVRMRRGDNVWTNAYTVSTNGNKVSKPEYILGHVLEGAYRHTGPVRLQSAARESLQAFSTVAQQVDGIGGFMAYEAACDLRWCPGWLDKAPDIYTWANTGPGAKRGLNRLWGRPFKQGLSEKQSLAEMSYLLQIAPYHLEPHMPQPLEMRDIEHSLCETDKYLRVQNGEGRPRSHYRPPVQQEELLT